MLLAVILLLVGGLIVSSLLAYMGNGLLGGRVYEKRTAELYAADAGVEDAVWKIQSGEVAACPAQPNQPPYYISVNGKNVTVTITLRADNMTYLVESTATGGGSGTKIDAYVSATIISGNYSGILDNVITSRCDYTLQGGQSQVEPPEGEEHGPEGDYTGDWPTAEIFSNMYLDDVEDYPYSFGTLDVENYASGFGPLYRNETLDIINTGANLEVQLTGTVYVTGDTQIGMTNQDFTLDLNGQTIFVESATGAAPEDDPCNPSENQYALRIGGKCTLTGSGCIIVVGNIEFKPNLQSQPEDYIFVLSIRGKTYMQPIGDFHGTLAGSAEVYIQNGKATWWDSPFIDEGLNFPYIAILDQLYNIASWEVKQL
jgi:hypothetical protein